MNETNNLFSAMMAALGMVLADFYGHLAPWLLLGMGLVFADLRFGILAARARKEEIRPSRAWRRTLNKMVDYLCWVTLAEMCSRTFGITLGAPVVSIAMLFVIYGIELNSCVNNYLEYKGIKKKWNFFRLVGKEDLLEERPEESETTNENEDAVAADKGLD
ncbi:MAG: hypothetical protein J6K19_03870 [Prevotella sp.]|nr:hypothetical protein [Prevotella sp.]